MSIPNITFGKKIYCENEGQNTFVYSYCDVEVEDFSTYISELKDCGFKIFDEHMAARENHIIHLQKEGSAIYAMYYSDIQEMRIVYEPDSEYLKFKDTPCAECCKSLLTNIDLEDYGMSYVIRLKDGRFIIFDGGWDFEPDADKLMECLRRQSPHTKPVIAAWIMTHSDIDHYMCFITFSEKYLSDVIIERFIYNFPDPCEDNLERIPALDGWGNMTKLPRFYDCVKKSGATVFRAHTGQVYRFSNAELEILSSPDDTFVTPVKHFNDLSLVIKMTLESQTILWCGDAYFEKAKLAQRWGEYLKSDILQIPHHGFNGGRKEEYSLINPTVCILPAKDEADFGMDNIYRSENRYLIYDLNVQDFFMGGSGEYTLELPYSPRANGKNLLFRRVDFYQKSVGAYSWYFDDVTKECCKFTIINSTSAKATIYVDLYFEDAANTIKDIKLEVDGCRRKCVDIFDSKTANHDALFFNRDSMKAKGVPEGVPFTVHFKSDIPIIVKGNIESIYCF